MHTGNNMGIMTTFKKPTAERPPLLPQHVWRSLSPTTQAQVRATLLRILQEIPYDTTPIGEGH